MRLGLDPALLVILGGVSAALHVGKLPTALPLLHETLGVTLVQGGFLLSLVQLAGMVLGLPVGMAADRIGLKRTMLCGLLILSAASFLGSWADGVKVLMLLRALEGLGFLLACMPAPGLIRRLVSPARLGSVLGMWGGYMPLGIATALLFGPIAITQQGWQGWWRTLAILSACMAVWIWLRIPADAAAPARGAGSVQAGWLARLRNTLRAPGPWLVALSFAMYSSQWLAVIGFLPTMYARAGLDAGVAGMATALAALVNMAGNAAAGRLLERGIRAHKLLCLGFAVMGFASVVAFAPVWGAPEDTWTALWRYAAVLLFSMVGGLVPGTLFFVAVRHASGEGTTSTIIGWMQQWSALGQFLGPPLVAYVAVRAGGWQWSWLVTCGCAACGLALAIMTGALLGPSSPPHGVRRPGT